MEVKLSGECSDHMHAGRQTKFLDNRTELAKVGIRIALQDRTDKPMLFGDGKGICDLSVMKKSL
jgi:hypothetical protein